MPEKIIKDYRAEINRYEERLIGIRGEVAELDKQKTISGRDIDALTKHLAYLDLLKTQKEAEIDRKEKRITDLNSQIEDEQNKFDKLQHDASIVSEVLEEKKTELIEVERKLLEHDGRMSKETDIIAKKHKEADEKHSLVKDKEQKLRNFLAEL